MIPWRRVVTTVGPDGRSTIEADRPVPVYRLHGTDVDPHTFDGGLPVDGEVTPREGECVVIDLWETAGSLRTSPSFDADRPFQVECPPGGTRWRIVVFGPHRVSAMHRTRTLDYDAVLDGEITLELEDGSARALRRGDMVVLPGTKHRWRTESTGCVLLITMIDRPDAEA